MCGANVTSLRILVKSMLFFILTQPLTPWTIMWKINWFGRRLHNSIVQIIPKALHSTHKAVGTIWRALSKPPQRWQGPQPRPLWLLVRTPSAFGPELVYRLRVAQPTLVDVPIYLRYNIILPYMFVYLVLALMTSSLWMAVGPKSLEGGLFTNF